MSRKYILLHASAGYGHKKAAEAVAEALRTLCPGDCVEVWDALDFFPKWVKKAYADGYVWMISDFPALWGMCYRISELSWMKGIIRPARRFFHAVLGRKLERYLRNECPAVVISTHFMSTEIAGHLRSRGAAFKALTVVTDYLVHPFWLNENIDGYAAAADETRKALIRSGIDPSKIRLTGIPVGAHFRESQDPAEARRRLGLSGDGRVLLFTSGGSGAGIPIEQIEAMLIRRPSWQAVVVCGSSADLKRRAEAVSGRVAGRLRAEGFVRNMHEWMDAADVVIGKAGGITVTESLAKRKKFVVIRPVPGQEEWNAEVLRRADALVRVDRLDELESVVAGILDDPSASARLEQGIQKVSRPLASFDIARWAVELVESEDKPI